MSIHHIENEKGCKHETFSFNARIDIIFTVEKYLGFYLFYTTKLIIKIIKFQLLRSTDQIDHDFESI